jgi:glycogen debranching enzyme GlgX
VIFDVVFNHSGEGDALGPTASLRGLDNATYYRLDPDDRAGYRNEAGCGNTLDCSHPAVVRLIMDSLRAWAVLGGVDGFRFDLAATLGRGRSGAFDPHAPLFAAILQDPVLRDLKLIAEAWDIGPGGYRVGALPAPFADWNDRSRDAIRRFWRGDRGMVPELATRIAGSSDLFARRRRPSLGINFVTAHDGFTLADLVAHARKHNEANGEANRDGTDANHSWNNGVEGATADRTILARRLADQKALLATLLLSLGTPMLAMGSELGHSQQGNNNAYAQDNALSWLDWSADAQGLDRLVADLIALRSDLAFLQGDRFLTGLPLEPRGRPDVMWLRADGAEMREADWAREADTLFALFSTPMVAEPGVETVLIAFNRSQRAVRLARTARPEFARLKRIFASGDARDEAARLVAGPRSVSLWRALDQQ